MNRVRLTSVVLFAALLLGGCKTTETKPAEVAEAQPAAIVVPACAGRPLRKAQITAFPLRYPEQIQVGEYMHWPQITAEELARKIERSGRMRVVASPQRQPFADPESAPTKLRTKPDGAPMISDWATQERAQYVIAGIIQDFGTAKRLFLIPERQLVIEAFIYDAIGGELLARREFSRQVLFNRSLPKTVNPGTGEFTSTQLGSAYIEILEDIRIWAEEVIPCQPFPLRVTRIDGRRLYLDAGRDSGIEAGMELAATPPVSDPGAPPRPRPPGSLAVKEVLANSSIAEIPQQRTPHRHKVGDVLYAQ